MGVEFFGQFLLRRGVISRPQLLQTLDHQEIYNQRFGAYAVSRGMLTPDQCECIEKAQGRGARRFGQVAVDLGLLSQQQVEELLTLQLNDHLYLGAALTELGHIDPARLAQELAAFNETQRAWSSHAVRFPPGIPADERVAIAVELALRFFTRITGLPAKLGPARPDPPPPPVETLTAALELSGDRAVLLAVSVSRELARLIARAMLQIRDEIPPQVVGDTLCEFLNIVCGDACGKCAQLGRRVAITPPCLVDPRAHPLLLFPFELPEGLFEIRTYPTVG